MLYVLAILGIVFVIKMISESKKNPSRVKEWTERKTASGVSEAQIRKVSRLKRISEVKFDGPKDEIVEIHYRFGLMPLEKFTRETVDEAATTAARAFSGLFELPGIEQVTLCTEAISHDDYGKLTKTYPIKITWDRATAEKVEWNNFWFLLSKDPFRVYRLAKKYYIHRDLFSRREPRDDWDD